MIYNTVCVTYTTMLFLCKCFYSTCLLQFNRVRPLPLHGARPVGVDDELLFLHRQQIEQLLSRLVCKDCMMECKMVVHNTGVDCRVDLECLCSEENTVSPAKVSVPPEFSKHGKYFTEGNITLVYHSIISNQGYAGFDRLAGILQ